MQKCYRRTDFEWRPQKSVLFVVDCKPLAMVANGQSPCQEYWCESFQKIIEKLLILVSLGFAPKDISEDFIQWRPRGENVRADSLCNLAMDQDLGLNWRTSKDTPRTHFLVHSDGALRRSSSLSAIGYTITERMSGGNLKIVADHASLVNAQSSFHAELDALDCAICAVIELVCK